MTETYQIPFTESMESTPLPSVQDNTQQADSSKMHSEAFYASSLVLDEDPTQRYLDIIGEFKESGYSATIDIIKNRLRESKDLSETAVVESLIADETVPREQKSEILRQWSMGNKPDVNLQQEYLEHLSNMSLAQEYENITPEALQKADFEILTTQVAQDLEETEKAFHTFGDKVYTADSPVLEDIGNKLKKIGNGLTTFLDTPVESSFYDVTKSFAREPINLTRGLLGIPQLFIELASVIVRQGLSKTGELTGIKWLQETYPDISWGEALQRVTDVSQKYGYVNYLDEYIFKNLLDEEDFEKGIVAGVFKTIDDAAQYIADKTSPDDPERVKVPLLFGLFFLNRGIRTVKKQFEPKAKETETYQDLKAREEGGPGVPNRLKAQVKFAIEQPKTTLKQVGQEAPKSSPFVQTVALNSDQTKRLAQMAFEDIDGATWKALGLTPEQFIQTYFGAEVLGKDRTGTRFYDGLEDARLMMLDNLIDRSKNIIALEPTFLDLAERKAFGESFISDAGSILEHPEIRMIGSKLNISVSGTRMTTSVDFRKSSTDYYKDAKETANIATYIQEKLKVSERTTNDGNRLLVEVVNPETGGKTAWTVDSFAKVAETFKGEGLFNIRWEKTGDFVDSIKAGSEGFGYQGHQGKIAPLATLFAKPKAWNMFFNYGRLSKEVQLKRDISGLRALGIMNDKVQIILDMANKESQVWRNDLATIYSRMGKYDRTLTHKDIVNELGYNPQRAHVAKIQEALRLTEDINYFTWQLQNMYEVNRYAKAGYKGHVELVLDNSSKKNFMVKTEVEPLAIDLNNVKTFFDVNQQKEFQIIQSQYKFENGKHYIVDETGSPISQIYRLGETLIKEGKRYNYVSLPYGAQIPGLPSQIIPYRKNYMPAMVDNTIFVRRYPKAVEVDGKKIAYNAEDLVFKEMSPYKEAVAAFNSKVEADAWLRTTKQDANYFYKTEKASELSVTDMTDFAILQETALRSSKNRGSALQFALYDDPLTSLIETTKVAGLKFMMSNSAEQLKIGWMKRWKNSPEVIIDNNVADSKYTFSERAAKGVDVFLEQETAIYDQFPLSSEQIRPVAGKEKLHVQALEEYEAIVQSTKGYEQNLTAEVINKLADYGGELAERKGWKRVESKLRKLERNPNLPVDILTKVPTTMYVSIANPVKHWIQQPAQGISYMTIASNGNPLVFGSIFKDAIMTSSALFLKNLRKADYEKAIYDHMNNNMGIEQTAKLSWADHQFINKYGREAGLFRMNEHIFAKDTLFHKAPGLVREGLLKRNARKFTNFMSTIGLQTGEYLHRVAAFHSSKRVWEQNNPGKNWRDTKAMDEIIYGARQLTQSMDAMASNTFQRVGFLKPFMMLQTFMARASESAISGEASPFNAKQRGALFGTNVALYGIGNAAPFGLGYYLLQIIKDTLGEEAAQNIDESNVTDLVFQFMSDTLTPTYDEDGNQIFTTTRPSLYISPYGSTPFAPWINAVKAFGQASGYMEPDRNANIALKYWTDAYANVNLIYRMWGLDMPTEEKLEGSVKQLAKLTSIGKNYLNAFLSEAGDRMMISSSGQNTGERRSIGDKLGAFLLNTMPETVKNDYKYLSEDKATENNMKKLANEYVDALYQAHTRGLMNSAELMETFSGFFAAAQQGHGWTDKEFDMFWRFADSRNTQLQRTTKSNVFNSIVQNYQLYLNDLNKDQINNLQRIVKNFKDNPEINRDGLTLIKAIEDGLQSRTSIGLSPIEIPKEGK